MIEMIEERRGSEKKEQRYDLFTSLLDANEEESDGITKLSDSEVMGSFEIACVFFSSVLMLNQSSRQHLRVPHSR